MSVMFAQASSATYVRGEVICQRCGTAVQIRNPTEVADEFSARCNHCGRRGFFRRRDIDVESAPDRRAKPRHDHR